MANHCGDHAARADEEPPVLVMVLRGLDELLEVIRAAHLFGRGEVRDGFDQPQALALRAEQRLLHELAALREHARGDRHGIALMHRGEGARRGDAGLLQEERGGGLVDAALDGARIVPHRHAELTQAMQQAEIERDLLERAARHEAHEGAFRQAVAEPGNGEPRGRLGGEAAKY